MILSAKLHIVDIVTFGRARLAKLCYNMHSFRNCVVCF